MAIWNFSNCSSCYYKIRNMASPKRLPYFFYTQFHNAYNFIGTCLTCTIIKRLPFYDLWRMLKLIFLLRVE